MTISRVNAAAVGVSSSISTPISGSFDVTGCKLLVIFPFAEKTGSTVNVTGVTVGGNAATLKASQSTGGGNFDESLWCYSYENALTGVQTISAAFTGGNNQDGGMVVLGYTADGDLAVSAATPGATETDSGTVPTVSVTMSDAAGWMVACHVNTRADNDPIAAPSSTAGTPSTGVQTSAGGGSSGASAWGGDVAPGAAGVNTLTWTLANQIQSEQIAIEILEAAGDAVAPTYSVAPALDTKGDTTADFVATASDETAAQVDHYMALYAAGSTPSEADVKAGAGTGFVSGSAKSVLAVNNGVEAAFPQQTGLTPAGAYRAAFTVEEQGGGNLATVVYVDFTTTETFTGSAAVADAQAAGETPLLTNPITIRLTLVDRFLTDRPNLTALSWSWFDEDDAGALGTPTDQGTAETTDANAELAIVLNNTALLSSQWGRLAVESDDKSWSALYRLQIP